MNQYAVMDYTQRQRGAHRSDPNRTALEAVALMYTSTELGNSSGIRFALSIEDAHTWCSSSVSRGSLHGTKWAYFWTSAWNYCCEQHEHTLDLTGMVDSGEWDERIVDAGCKKISLIELPPILEPLGIRCIGVSTANNVVPAKPPPAPHPMQETLWGEAA